MGQEHRPWMLTPLSKPREARSAEKGRTKSKKFDSNCFWCSTYGHMMEDCQKKAAGKPQAPKSPQGSDPKPKGNGKGGKGKKGASLDEWPDGQEYKTSGEKPNEEAASLFIGAFSRHEKYSRQDWLASERISRNRHNVSGNPTRVVIWAPVLSILRWVRESI